MGVAQGLAANPDAPYRTSLEQSGPVLSLYLFKAEAAAHSHT